MLISVVQEASHLDFPMVKVFSQKAILELADKAGENGFSGALVFSKRGHFGWHGRKIQRNSRIEKIQTKGKI